MADVPPPPPPGPPPPPAPGPPPPAPVSDPGRSALLGSINNFSKGKLKKAATNDRYEFHHIYLPGLLDHNQRSMIA